MMVREFDYCEVESFVADCSVGLARCLRASCPLMQSCSRLEGRETDYGVHPRLNSSSCPFGDHAALPTKTMLVKIFLLWNAHFGARTRVLSPPPVAAGGGTSKEGPRRQQRHL